MRLVRVFVRGERAILASAGSTGPGSDFSEMGVYWLDGSRRRYALAYGFADVPELVRQGAHFAWLETSNATQPGCPCSARAGDEGESFLIAQGSSPLRDLRLRARRIRFRSGDHSALRRVPFTAAGRIRAAPDPGTAHAAFRLAVAIPRRLPRRGHVHVGIGDLSLSGPSCSYREPQVDRARHGRAVTFVLRAPRQWCEGSYRGTVSYTWGDSASGHGCATSGTVCAGEVVLGRFRLAVVGRSR